MASNSRSVIAVTVGAASLLGAGLWLLMQTRPAANQAATTATPATQNVDSAGVSASRELPGREAVLLSVEEVNEEVRIEENLFADDPGTPMPGAMVEAAKETLAQYQAAMVYPRWSRAADESVPHLLRPNQPQEIGQEFAADSQRREIRTDLRLDRWFIAPGETALATLTVTRQDEPGVAFNPDSVEMRIEYYDPIKVEWPTAERLKVQRSGDTWSAVIDPSKIHALSIPQQALETRLIARVQVGEFFKDLPLMFSYQTKSPFRVLAKTADRMKNGSLEVDFEVEADLLRPVDVMAVLYDESGSKPIVYYDWRFDPTKTGKQTMTVTFFGRVIREAGIDGPYQVKNLRGAVVDPDAYPAQQPWFADAEPSATTGAYRSSEFSGDEFQSAEKELLTARYRDIIDRGGI